MPRSAEQRWTNLVQGEEGAGRGDPQAGAECESSPPHSEASLLPILITCTVFALILIWQLTKVSSLQIFKRSQMITSWD